MQLKTTHEHLDEVVVRHSSCHRRPASLKVVLVALVSSVALIPAVEEKINLRKTTQGEG
jgi:hypothetical protein